jgi:hypothetical protein
LRRRGISVVSFIEEDCVVAIYRLIFPIKVVNNTKLYVATCKQFQVSERNCSNPCITIK